MNTDLNICKTVKEPPKIQHTPEIKRKISEAIKSRVDDNFRERSRQQAIKIWSNPNHLKMMKEINKGSRHPQAKINEDLVKLVKLDTFNKVKRSDTIKK